MSREITAHNSVANDY